MLSRAARAGPTHRRYVQAMRHLSASNNHRAREYRCFLWSCEAWSTTSPLVARTCAPAESRDSGGKRACHVDGSDARASFLVKNDSARTTVGLAAVLA